MMASRNWGQQGLFYQIPVTMDPWYVRLAKRLAVLVLLLAWSVFWRTVKTTVKVIVAGRYRRVCGPWYAAAGVWTAGALLHLTARGWVTAVVLAGMVAPYVWQRCGLPAGRLTRRRGLAPVARRAWYVGAYLSTAVWLVAAARWGAGPPLAGWLWLVIAPACFAALCWRYRTRHEDVPVLGEFEQVWATIPGLEKTALVNVRHHDNPRRVQADVDLADCDLLAEKLGSFRPQIAKKHGVPQTNVIAGYRPDRLESVGNVEVVFDNPCNEPVIYDKTWMPTADEIRRGIVPFHLYPNGKRGYLRFCYPGREPGIPGAGAVMTVFTGDIGSGKSAGMGAALTQLTMTGRAWPMAACPQGGASFPAWAGGNGVAAWKAPCRNDNLDPIMAQLLYLRELLYDRTDRLARFAWVDKWGDEQVGLNCWDYDIIAANAKANATTPWPLVVWGCDELWRLMLIPDYAEIVKELLKLGRKAGIKVMGATQYPGLEEFGNDAAMRQPLVAGNILCYRNKDGTTKSMILSSEMPSPDSIPAETPVGEDTKGTLIAEAKGPHSALPNFSRSVWVQREMHWAKLAAEQIHPLEVEAVKILRKYLPAGQNYTEARPTAPQPAAATTTPTSQPSGKGTYLDRVLVYLAGCDNYRATTGVIAAALNVPQARVSEALTRACERGDGRVVNYEHGVYGLSETARPRELEGVAA